MGRIADDEMLFIMSNKCVPHPDFQSDSEQVYRNHGSRLSETDWSSFTVSVTHSVYAEKNMSQHRPWVDSKSETDCKDVNGRFSRSLGKKNRSGSQDLSHFLGSFVKLAFVLYLKIVKWFLNCARHSLWQLVNTWGVKIQWPG